MGVDTCGFYHNEIPQRTRNIHDVLGLLADLPIPESTAPLLIRKLSQLSLDEKPDDVREQRFYSLFR